MFDSVSIVFFILWVLVVGLFSYAAYWAFIIRKVLVTGLYRKQALWAGIMGLYLVSLSTFLTIALSFNLNTLPVNILGRLISFRSDNLLSRSCRGILSLQKCKVSRPSWASFAPRCLARMSSESVFRLLQQSSLCLGY